jgi:hypothetical protein
VEVGVLELGPTQIQIAQVGARKAGFSPAQVDLEQPLSQRHPGQVQLDEPSVEESFHGSYRIVESGTVVNILFPDPKGDLICTARASAQQKSA